MIVLDASKFVSSLSWKVREYSLKFFHNLIFCVDFNNFRIKL